ncbi:arylsulfatase B-like isoform X2 [Paramacrobiotus metropolitanus]|uniref:arylsulfatase B-like isoform X2 n=1 Tax=Paramacrobiotus metropolitanus TaxID=2943436 RepID=UPI002445863D|nr:arylsulfatase B-like isoform X2 [Paramacrobiotus metropolitanus]
MDGGYGWVVVLATFLVNAVVQGVIASTGVLLNVLLDQFNAGRATIGWIPSLLGGLLLAVGPFSSYLIDKSSCRTVTIVGAVVASFGCILSSFATGINFLIISYGIITGFGFGLMYLPQTIVLAEWFKESRSTATGIGLSGAGFGAFIIPPLAQHILKLYGWKSYFTFSGILISLCCVVGILLRPNPEHQAQKRCSTALFSASYRIPFSFLPDYAVRQLNTTKSDAAYLLSYLGIASFLGRVLGGFIGDHQRHRRFLVYMFLNVMAGFSVEAMGLAGSYFQLALCSLGYGAASGGRVALNSIILADIFGLSVLSQTFGLVCLVQGVSIFFGTPIAGWLADIFGNYRTSFIIFGTGMLSCASVLSFIPSNRRSHISNYTERRISWLLRMLPFVIIPLLLGNTPTVVRATRQVVSPAPPNIIIIVADDLGWNDVSFHGYKEIPTPNLDKLAAEGIILNSHYAHYMCTPSRAALMTGKYSFRTGLQHYVLRAGEPRGLPLEEKLFPQYMRELGYSTHLVGKWHLGYARNEMTPTFRGFDSFFGYYTGYVDYYNYTPTAVSAGYSAFDMWDGLQPAKASKGQYATNLFTHQAIERIREHNSDRPLFLILSHLAPHYANEDDPVQAPKEYIDRFQHIAHEGRRKYAATVAVLDDAVGELVEALSEKKLLENSVILFSSDNGGAGAVEGIHFGPPSSFASNWPLRGAKASQFEGGVRVASFIWSPLLKSVKRVSSELYHITDWLSTFYRLGGGIPLRNMDGLDIWDSLSHATPSPRTEIVLQIDPVWKEYAIRLNQYKLVWGSNLRNNNRIDDWYIPETGIQENLVVDSPGALSCGQLKNDRPCDASVAPCLFDVVQDPCEYNNLAEQLPDVVDLLLGKIRKYNATAAISQNVPLDPKAKASLNNGLMQPWLH